MRYIQWFILLIIYMGSAVAEEQPEEAYVEEVNETIIIHPNPEDDWLFGFHDVISDSVFGTAKWFDSFFATEDGEDLNPESLARIRLGWEPRARDLDVFSQKFRVRIKLPYLADRADLMFSDEADDDNVEQQFDNDKSLTNGEDGDSFTAAIRFINLDQIEEYVDSRIGISGGDIFSKVRVKLTSDFGTNHRVKFYPSIFYYIDDGFGSRVLLEYDYNYAADKQFKTNISWRNSEAYTGQRWRSGLYHLHRLDRFRATSLGLVVRGESRGERGFLIESYTLSFRYRVNAYRNWLFFEAEPFVEWPEEEDYKSTPGIALRVEGYFQRN